MHVLSSFQRTGGLIPLRRRPSSGEPFNLTKAGWLCQPPAFSFFVFFAGHDSRHFQQFANHRRAFSPGMVEPRRLALADVRRTAPNSVTIRSSERRCQPPRRPSVADRKKQYTDRTPGDQRSPSGGAVIAPVRSPQRRRRDTDRAPPRRRHSREPARAPPRAAASRGRPAARRENARGISVIPRPPAP